MRYNIAELTVEVVFKKSDINNKELIPSFSPFETKENGEKDDIFFTLTIDDTLKPKRKGRERIGKFDTGNGMTVVDHYNDGSYQFIIKDINDRECCLLQTDKEFKQCYCALNGDLNMRRFGLNNALMLVYAFAGSKAETLLMHASLVRHNGYGYAFIAKSGTGKSTQVSNWLKYIPNCDLMNDDNPIIRFINGEPWIYGSPWSGKTPCYRNVKAKLGAITRIERDHTNHIEKLGTVTAFASVLPSCSTMKWDSDIFNAICNSVTKLVETSKIYTLHCLPNKESAIICYKEISN